MVMYLVTHDWGRGHLIGLDGRVSIMPCSLVLSSEALFAQRSSGHSGNSTSFYGTED